MDSWIQEIKIQNKATPIHLQMMMLNSIIPINVGNLDYWIPLPIMCFKMISFTKVVGTWIIEFNLQCIQLSKDQMVKWKMEFIIMYLQSERSARYLNNLIQPSMYPIIQASNG